MFFEVPVSAKKKKNTLHVFKKKLYLIKMITLFSFFKLSALEGQLRWVCTPPHQPSCAATASLYQSVSSHHLSFSMSFPPAHCGSVNCSYSNIPSLPSPQLSFSQPLSCGIINLLVLSTCKSQTIVPYGTVWGARLFIL